MQRKYLKILTSPLLFSQRYTQEFPQSEVFEYGHGVRDRLQPQEKVYRSSSHVQSRGMQKVEKLFNENDNILIYKIAEPLRALSLVDRCV